ncbi:MAG: CotH kinase family protein [Polyangiales bacterium]
MMRSIGASVGFALLAACVAGCSDSHELDGKRAEPEPAAQIIDVVRRDAGLGTTTGTSGRGNPAPSATTPPSTRGSQRDPLPCAPLFDPSRVPTIEITMSPSERAALEDEFRSVRPDEDGSGLYNPWHPVVFRLDGQVRTDAMMRLKGDWSWKQTVALDARPKAQFVVAFDRVDPNARFQGVSRLELDMVRDDPTYLRERVGHHILRALGVPTVCANSVRLDLDGRYHGVYTAMEELNPELLPRLFPGAATGALWKSGTQIESEGSPAVFARQEAWKTSLGAGAMSRIIDLDQALYAWAAEIVLNNADGYYGGNHNFFTYDHPTRGFQWLPTDLDSTFDYLDWNIHPIYWWEQHDSDQTAGHHFRAVMLDPTLRARLVDAVERVIARWDAPGFQSRVDAWSRQISDAVRDDPHRFESLETIAEATGWLRDTVHHRPEWLKPWITCERTGRGTDEDRDGAPWCKDCNDRSAAQRPGAREVCGNAADEDCDGLRDEGCPGGPREPEGWSSSTW